MEKLILEKIEQIAKEKYPDVPYWIDTGNRSQVAYAMLETFERDLKIRKDWQTRISKFFKELITLTKGVLE